ncbi:hypothetical protein J4442_05730 [Candidatus Woesearchaeota archaeon]|nr:hypothetical protein [Candidatus Woesearchaeota archaeon]
MSFIFEIEDKSGRKIHLDKKQWEHIAKEHPEVNKLEYIEETLKNPLKITTYEYDDTIKYYYKYFKERKTTKYLMIIVKYLNGKGFIITAYFVRYIR